MKKKSTKKSTKLPRISLKKIIAIILTATIIASLGYLGLMQKITQNNFNDLATIKIGTLIIEAIDNLNDPLPIDPQTGERYISEAKLRLPANGFKANRLVYSYNDKIEDYPAEVRLASVSAIDQYKVKLIGASSVEKMFEAVPGLQACSRGFRLSFESAPQYEEGLMLVFEKTLKDGRNLKVHAEANCMAPEFFDLEYLKQIDSY